MLSVRAPGCDASRARCQPEISDMHRDALQVTTFESGPGVELAYHGLQQDSETRAVGGWPCGGEKDMKVQLRVDWAILGSLLAGHFGWT